MRGDLPLHCWLICIHFCCTMVLGVKECIKVSYVCSFFPFMSTTRKHRHKLCIFVLAASQPLKRKHDKAKEWQKAMWRLFVLPGRRTTNIYFINFGELARRKLEKHKKSTKRIWRVFAFANVLFRSSFRVFTMPIRLPENTTK